jgi:gamma-glutamylcyclotransferase (GGCT)/AIG2-like uncharacterized protein YtfP
VTDLLFVYGTLLSGVGHPMGTRLRREAQLLGAATFQGRLYRVAWYPGVVDGEDGDVVHGELYRLSDPYSVFVWLDEFEGVTRGASSVTDPDEYARVVRQVTGREVGSRAWLHVYLGAVDHLARRATGRWHP